MADPRSPTQAGQPVRVYPLKWMESVFSSREKTEYLLKPEVENGNVTYHDMELAQSLFGSRKRHLPLIYSSIAFLGVVAYSQGFARPKWRLTKLMTTSTLLGFCSYSIGFNQNLSAHIKFARSLENPVGFNQALRNVNARLGGREHFPYGVPERREELVGAALGPTFQASPTSTESTSATTEPTEGWAVSPSQEDLDQNQTEQTHQVVVQRPTGKWDEIRAANNKAGAPSSWDVIRQSHERNKTPPQSSQSATRSGNPVGGTTGEGTYDRYNSSDLDPSITIDEREQKWDKRALDEARFEAVLEAERRRASKS